MTRHMTVAEAWYHATHPHTPNPDHARFFDPETVRLLCRPNLSPVVSRRTFVDFDGSGCDYTTHEDGSVTVVAQRLK